MQEMRAAGIRRRLMVFTLLLAALLPAHAAFPERPLRLVVGFSPGGAGDTLARLIATKLGERLHQSVVVDNKPGAGTLLAAQSTVQSPADGHTLMLVTSSAELLALRNGPTVDLRKDFVLISPVAQSDYVLVAGPKSPFKTFSEMVAYAKANPGKVSYGHQGVGSSTHLLGEFIADSLGVKLLPVPYKGSAPTVTALLGGEVMMTVDGIGPTTPHIREGRLIGLAYTGEKRARELPDVPAIRETQPTLVTPKAWYGLGAPAGTPQPVIDQLRAALLAVVAMPEVQEKMRAMSIEPITSSQESFRAMVNNDIEAWSRIVKKANIEIQ
jgi:tripartite-type tricarboxylate transporter receptor subunit TctC